MLIGAYYCGGTRIALAARARIMICLWPKYFFVYLLANLNVSFIVLPTARFIREIYVESQCNNSVATHRFDDSIAALYVDSVA